MRQTISSRIGFDRLVKRGWLDVTAERVLGGASPEDLRAHLHAVLAEAHPGDKARSNTITVLVRTWASVPDQHLRLRREALSLWSDASHSEGLWLHWGMALLAYPVFHATAEIAGRLLRLQGELTLSQVQRRLVELLGSRSTLGRASRRMVRSMVEWKALADTEQKGTYCGADRLTSESSALQLWLLEACHVAGDAESVEALSLIDSPALFPFALTVGTGDLRRSKRFAVHRQGVDMDVVEVRDATGRGRL